MYVGLSTVNHYLDKFKTQLVSSDNTHCLTGWTKLENAATPYSPHTLYAAKANEVPEDFLKEKEMHLLCLVPDAGLFDQICDSFPNTSVLLVEAPNTDEVYTSLQEYFNIQSGVGMYGQTLFECLSFGDGLQNAIDYSYRIFRNPIFVFDTNNNMIAATWDAIKELKLEDDVILGKGFSENSYMQVNKDHFHDRMIKSEIPVRKFNDDQGYEQMFCAINVQKNLGHICISAVNKPFEPIDVELMIMLKKFVNQVLYKDSFNRNAKGFNYEYFIRDILDEKITAEHTFNSRTENIQKKFFGNLYCMVVESAYSVEILNAPMVRNTLESHFPNSKVLIYNGQIICIISIPSDQQLSREYRETARKLCKELRLFAGLSNCFQNILELPEYYNQALRCIELGISYSNNPDFFCYDNYYMDHLINVFLQKRKAKAFCQPKMQILLDYDKKHNSELAYTMYMSLINERNLAAASEAMNMHRTSLVYRFKKIYSLIGENFDDYQERLYMILSYEMTQKDIQKDQ